MQISSSRWRAVKFQQEGRYIWYCISTRTFIHNEASYSRVVIYSYIILLPINFLYSKSLKNIIISSLDRELLLEYSINAFRPPKCSPFLMKWFGTVHCFIAHQSKLQKQSLNITTIINMIYSAKLPWLNTLISKMICSWHSWRLLIEYEYTCTQYRKSQNCSSCAESSFEFPFLVYQVRCGSNIIIAALDLPSEDVTRSVRSVRKTLELLNSLTFSMSWLGLVDTASRDWLAHSFIHGSFQRKERVP